MTCRPIFRQTVILMRDALGRFTRVRATLAELAARMRPRVRRVYRPLLIVCEQLALF